MIPLTSQVPASAPTNNKIIMGIKTLFRFSQISFNITSIDTLLKRPTTAATPPPKRRIIWLE